MNFSSTDQSPTCFPVYGGSTRPASFTNLCGATSGPWNLGYTSTYSRALQQSPTDRQSYGSMTMGQGFQNQSQNASPDVEFTDAVGAGSSTYSGNGMEEEMDMDSDVLVGSLSAAMSDLSVKNPICVICKSSTSEKVTELCSCKCVYFCHESCLVRWITYKQNDAFCVMCTVPYDIELIERAIFHSSRLSRLYGQRKASFTQSLPQISAQTLSRSLSLPSNFNTQQSGLNVRMDLLSPPGSGFDPNQVSPQAHPQNTPYNTPMKSSQGFVSDAEMGMSDY